MVNGWAWRTAISTPFEPAAIAKQRRSRWAGHMTTRSLPEAAYEYALDGFLVLPLHYPNVYNECSCGSGCPRIGKHPLTGHGLNDGSAGLLTVQSWWERWPHANIGLLIGIASGIVVVDIDDQEVFDALGLELIDASASE